MSDLMLNLIDSRAAGACQICGKCDVCHAAKLAVADWVIRLHESRRRHGKAVGSKSPEQRRYVKNLTLGMLEMLGLEEPPPGTEADKASGWGKSMRARQLEVDGG